MTNNNKKLIFAFMACILILTTACGKKIKDAEKETKFETKKETKRETAKETKEADKETKKEETKKETKKETQKEATTKEKTSEKEKVKAKNPSKDSKKAKETSKSTTKQARKEAPKQISKPKNKSTTKAQRQAPVAKSSQQKQVFLNELNKYRSSHGLAPVKYHPQFQAVADIRAKELGQHNYMAHIRPDRKTLISDPNGYKGVFDGSKYTINGENLAGVPAQSTSSFILSIWKKSPGHNRYLLYPDIKYIGLGIAEHPEWGASAVLIGGYSEE